MHSGLFLENILVLILCYTSHFNKNGERMKLVRDIIFALIIVGILCVSFTCISAADVDNVQSNMTHDDLSDLQIDGNGLNHEDSNIEGLNNCEIEKSLENSMGESVVTQTNVSGNGNDIDESVALQDVSGNGNDIDESVALQNISNNGNFDNQNISDLVNLTPISDNTYVYVLDNVTYTVYRVVISDLNSFRNAPVSAPKGSIDYNLIMWDFKDNLNLVIDPWDDVLIHLGNIKNFVIRGNGAKISVRDSSQRDERHLIGIDSDYKLWMSNITITGFNTAIVNNGVCQFTNVTFYYNRLCYLIDKDYGGAIRNYGILKCLNCIFDTNNAKYGGAVYNYQGSQSMFFDCVFKNNYAYGPKSGNLETNDGHNIHCCKGANCIISNGNDNIQCVLINSTQMLNDVLAAIPKLGHVRILVLNFTPNTYKLSNEDAFKLSFDLVENLIIYGNGATISVDADKSDECHFLKVSSGQNFQIDNLSINGFNRAIINEGVLSLTNTVFKNNKCDYFFSKDYGGAIYNDEGVLHMTNCSFENSYAKYGGAIYNFEGIIRCDGCSFKSNTAYSDGGALYNEKGHITCINTYFGNNHAEDGGGAIFNYYGEMVLYDDSFNANCADDEGGAIYNDFGVISLSNDMFIESKADAGKDVFTYGDEARYYVESPSHVFQQVTGGFLLQTLKVTSDTTSEAARWILRVTEVGLCVGLCVACSLAGMPEATAGIIGFVAGGLLAAGEEVIEECYLDHNFNFGNVVMMSVIAGLFDAATTVIGTAIGKVFFKTATHELTKVAAFKLSAICFAIEVAGEIATEVIPRFDFNDDPIETPIWDDKLIPAS